MYIHIPFCRKICSYCDFCKLFYNKNMVVKYLESLEKEIDTYYDLEEMETLYIGGGTPSCLDNSDLITLFKIINKINKSNNCEFTFECNIHDITEELLTILKNNKVNRLSIGVESFDNNNTIFLKRKYMTFEEVKKRISLAHEYGFNNINVDLIYAIPEEKISTLKKDIKNILKLGITHVSTYSLIIEEHTILHNNDVQPISEELDAKMYDLITSMFKNKGFVHYEVSNFALPGYESKHNLCYWNNNEYYGFGPGAAGYKGGVRYENSRSINKYLNKEYHYKEDILSKREIMENELMLGLRKMQGINLEEFYDRYNINAQEVFNIQELVDQKLLTYKDGYIFIPKDKIYVMNEILTKLI